MTLTLPDLPDEVAERLRAQAARHGRTLEAEAVACLRNATTLAPPEARPAETALPDATREAESEEAFLARIRARRERLNVHLTDEAIDAAIREGRP